MRMSGSMIGVDIGARQIRCAQGRVRGGVWTTCNVATVDRRAANAWTEPDATEWERVAATLGRRGFEGTTVRIAAPLSMLMVQALELPPRSSGAPIEQLAAMELARVSRVAPAEIEHACWEIPAPIRGGSLTHMIACGMRRADGERLAGAMERAGLTLGGIDLRGLALVRAAGSGGGASAHAIVDLGWEACFMCVVHEGAMVFSRSVERGAWRECVVPAATRFKVAPGVVEDAFDASLVAQHARSREDARAIERECRQATTAYLDAMCPEVLRSLAYVAQRYGTEITRVTLTGEGAITPGLSERLARSVPGGITTTRWRDEGAGVSGGVSAAMATAVGLAMPGDCAREQTANADAGQVAASGGRAA